MTFFKRINTITKPFIKNSVFRYSHHRYPEPYYLSQGERNIRQQKIIINLLGDFEYVDTASWEIYTFAQEKHLPSANIVYHDKMLKDLLFNNYSQFIVNRCYNMSCNNLLRLNQSIINLLRLNQSIISSGTNFKLYNLYVIPNATNRFTTNNFIKNCDESKIIIYPLESSVENKRRDINILIDN
jgi:hypothetical protein